MKLVALVFLIFPSLTVANSLASDWSVLVFHACEQVMKGREPDFATEVSHRTLLLKEIHPPVPREIWDGFSAPRVLWGQSGTKRWLKGLVKKDHPNGIITFNKEQNSIIIAFRGTKEPLENVNNFNVGITESPALKSVGFQGKVHAGYVNLFESLVDNLETSLLEILEVSRITGPIVVTGHSLGGSLATLAAAYLSHHQDIGNPVQLISFGAPYVGYEDFARWAEDRLAYAVSYIRATDLAPSFVADFFGTRLSWETGELPEREEQYGKRSYVGRKVTLPSYGASYLNFPKAHSMELYRQAIFEREGLGYGPLYKVVWSWPFAEDEFKIRGSDGSLAPPNPPLPILGEAASLAPPDPPLPSFANPPRLLPYQTAFPYLLRKFFRPQDE